jgi:hypothetical protein
MSAIERTDRIRLPAGEWHCSSDACRQALSCARRLAAVPNGASMQDGVLKANAGLSVPVFACSDFMSVSRAAAMRGADDRARSARSPKPWPSADGA